MPRTHGMVTSLLEILQPRACLVQSTLAVYPWVAGLFDLVGISNTRLV
jgi:hypothetical protein